MEEFVKELQKQLQEELNAIPIEPSPIRGYDKRIASIEFAIRRIREYLLENPFPNKEIEIQYFKNWSLPFVKLYIYYITLYNLEITRITCDREHLLQHLEVEKKRVMIFFNEHQEFYRYYYAGRTDEDEKYFSFKLPSRTTDFLIADSSFYRASLLLGELLAYEEYRAVLEYEIERLKVPNGKRIEIRVPKSAVAEILVPIFELQWIYIDDRPATLADLIKLVERGLHIDLKDFSIIDNSNRNRKKSISPYLEQMMQAANERRERLEP